MEYLKQFSTYSGHKHMVEMALFNVQKEISQKVGKSELRFMSSARRIIEL